ncbi:MAG: ABC transporter permease [Candidatus Electrothrix sp. AX5]|jgi:cell division transport system permease protein|uniref:Cell division protein FtsX n=3 Tax=Candidatus Electrothrix TaxID=1859128 RepID=A0A3S4T8I9_9BACT|nr:ABC transporter permease [Candidatus Electrothrix sp. AX5]RWX45313.1 cell division protein FtsX [Candidatus Electrothrix aarhusensis]
MKFLFAVLSQTWRNIIETWRSQLLSLVTITLSVLIFAFFYLVYMNALHAGDLLNNDLRLIVYLEEQPDHSLQEEYRHKIEKFDQVERIEFVSRLEAYDRFKEQLNENEDVLQEIPHDFLPPSIEIFPKRSLDTLSRIKLFSEYLQSLPGVLKVQYGREWVERFYSFIQLLRIIVLLSGALLILTTTFMMGHSIRLTMLTRKKELELLRLVGASDNYIRFPFFLEGAILGVLGAGTGLGALYLLFSWIQLRFSGQAMQGMFTFNFFSGTSVGMIILLAVLLCAGGSFTSTRKILNL